MIHPEKWRETADPFSIPFANFQLQTVLGYPHAGNDVFQVEGLYRGAPCRAFLKIARQPGADIAREAKLLTTLQLPCLPPVLEWSDNWILTREMPGQRLSILLEDNAGLGSMAYLPAYGRALAAIHQQQAEGPTVTDRKFFHLPPDDLAEKWGLQRQLIWLKSQTAAGETACFVHGDFHYANLLWQDGRLTAVLDWELAGQGCREFDLAWAVFRRPGQRFLTTMEEIEAFLQGYGLPFSKAAFWRYYVQIGLWFYPMGEPADRQLWQQLLQQAMEKR